MTNFIQKVAIGGNRMEFKDKVVLVTGAAAGIGKGIAEAFAAEGASLVLGDIAGEKLMTTVDELKAKDVKVVGLKGDISNVNDANALVDLASKTFGRLDVVVNNAGVVDRFLPVGEMTDEVWNLTIGVNLNGPMYTSRRAIPAMLQHGGGVIINISSVAGLGGAFAGAAYTASKHGLIGLTKNTAWMYGAQGIRCVAIAPGGVNSGITLGGEPSALGNSRLGPQFGTMPRGGEVKEIADVAVFLASGKASFINGAVVAADAGWSAGG